MADRNTVYDDPNTGPDLGPGRKAPSGKSSGSRGNLRNAEQGGGGSGNNRSGAAEKAASPSSLKDSEESGLGGAADSSDPGGEDLYNPSGDSRGRFGRARNRGRNLARKLASHKWLAGGALGGIGIIALILIILILLSGAYKVVDFAEHVAAYNFARVTRQMSESTDAITSEKIAVDTADKGVVKSTYDNIKSKYYDTATGKTKDLWSKFDQYRPQKIISNFQHDDTLAFNYRDGKFGRQILDSVTINGEEVAITRGTAKNLIPGYKFAKSVSFSRDFAPSLNDALEANNIGPVTRARVASQIRSELDIGLVAWAAGKFAGKTPPEAALEVERESTAAAEGKQLTFFDSPPASEPVKGGASDGLDAAATDVKDKLNSSLADDKEGAAIVDNPNQTPPKVADALANNASSVAANGLQGALGSFINSALSFINPVYKYAVPLCLIYDGSIQKSGPSIDTQSNQLQRSGLWVQSASGQQKDGFNASAEAVGATNWKLGDITKSNAEMRANGSAVNTSTTLSTQASPTGQYTYTIADYLGPVGNIIDTIAPVCPALTNIWVGVGLGAANIAVQVAGIFAGGEPTIAEAGADATAEAELGTQLSLFDASEFGTTAATSSSSFLSRQIIKAKASGSFAKQFAVDTTKQVITIGALTLLAQQLVAAEMGGSHSPTATGQSYDNGVDAGTNINANQTEQRQFYGAPMSDSDLTQDNKANLKGLALKENRQSTFNRYLAVKNPNSLLSRVAIMSSGYLNRSFFASLFKLGGGLFNPLRSLGSTLSPLISQTSFADPPVTSANTYYGNVQFGYTPGEENLINDPKFTYGDLLANQYALDQSGKEDEINATYGKCFKESIGEMLSSGDIKRDQNGNVRDDDSLCSPKTLGPHNPKYHDLVFRWRLAHNYDNTLDQLGQMQEVTAADSTGPAAPGTPASGNAQQLAQQILANNNITYSCGSSAQTDIQDAAAGKPGTAGAPVSKAILQLIATVGQNHKVCVSALESYGTNHTTGSLHYSGDAVDFGSVDGVTITGRNAPALTIIKIAEDILPNGSGFGQWHDPDTGALCGPVISLPSGFDQFDDYCNHLHVQVPRGTP